jgi:protein TonB
MISRDDTRDAIRWSLCAALILLVHGSVAWAVVHWKDPVEEAVPAGAISVELEPMPVSTTEEVKELAPAPEQVQAESAPEKPVEAEKAPEPEVPPAPKPEVALAVTPPKQEIEPKKEPEKPVEPEKKKPQPHTPAQNTTAPQAQKKLASRSAAPSEALPSQASASAIASWKSRLSAHLEAHKRSHGDKGIAILSFTVDQGGRVVGSRLAKSSGSAALDREALSLIQRAAPVPPPPPGIPGGRVSISVPLQYNMR